MTSPVLGFIININDDGPLPAIFSDMSVLGICLPSDDADPAAYPLNTPVDINTGELAALSKMGTGPLYQAIKLINSQLADLEVSARAVVVRVPAGASIDDTIANIVGDPGAGTGINAFLTSANRLGVVPRLLGCPGYTGRVQVQGGGTTVTHGSKTGMVGNGTLTPANPAYLSGAEAGQYRVVCIGGAKSAASAARAGMVGNGTVTGLSAPAGATVGNWRAVCEVAAANGGTFVVINPTGGFDGLAQVGAVYTSPNGGPSFEILDGSTDFAVADEFDIAVAATVPHGGGVFSVTAPDGGALPNATVGTPYADEVAFTIAAGSTDFQIGDEFDVNVSVTGGQILANPVCAALPSICDKLLAHAIVGAYVPGGTNTKLDEIHWRSTLNSRRLIPVGNALIVGNGEVNYIVDHAAAVLGIGVKRDFQTGGVPARVFGNEAIQGILGFLRYDSFSFVDGATDGQELLAAGIGILSRGEAIETSAAESGYITESYRNADTDTIWFYYNKSRIRDYTHLALIRTVRQRLEVTNVTLRGIQAVLNDMVDIAATIKRRGASVGYNVAFNASQNSATDLRLGKFTVSYSQEEPAPILLVDIESSSDYNALVVELSDIVSAAAGAVG